MATKNLICDSLFTGRTVYYTCKRQSDGHALLAASGAFAAPPGTIADGCLSMTESETVPGRYSASEARTVWTDGRYDVAAYSQNGGTPDPAHDGALGYGTMIVVSDADISAAAEIATSVWSKTLPL